MVSSVEKIENSIATIKIEVKSEDFNKAVNQSYNKNKGRFNIPGFRKGKAPRVIIERHYGENVFFEDAIDFAFPDAYSKAIESHDLFPVARPAMENIEKINIEEGFVFTVCVALKPEVELGEYKGAQIDKLTVEVTDEEIKKELQDKREQNSRLISVEDVSAKETDTVIIDFEGFIDNVPFDGGKAESFSLVLGSKQFIPGFEEQLIGVKKGEEKDVIVTFPDEYQANDLAGKESLFKVKVHEVKVKELPELDDEFVKDISEFDTVDELKSDIKTKIESRKLEEGKNVADKIVLDFAIDNATLELPEPMIEEEMDKSFQDFEYRMKMQGISIEDYFKYTNTKKEDLLVEIRKDVESRLKTDLVLEKITETENIEASDEEVEKEMENYAKMYNMDLDKLKESMKEQDNQYFVSMVKRKNTLEFLVENAVQK